MENTNIFFWGFILGAIGLGYLSYGVKQKKGVPLLSGVLLSGFSYFITNLLYMFMLAALFMLLPFFVKRLRG